MIKSIIAAAMVALCASPVCAGVKWLEKDYNFGLIKETDGKVPGRVRFVNTGGEPVVITGARPGCGCTGVEYPHDPIEPGDTAVISFTYNPAGRPGAFEKSIRVYIGDNTTERVMIRGTVLGTKESLAPIYPYEAGPLRLSDTILPPVEMKYGETRHLFINGYNQTSDTIVPAVKGATKALDIRLSTPKVAPGELVTIGFYYNSRMQPELGPVEMPVEIISDSRLADSPVTHLSFRADVKPDFSSLSVEDAENAPSCYVSPTTVDLGVISGIKPVPFSFSILNEGKSLMNILRITGATELVKVKRYPTKLKPGKSSRAEGAVNIDALSPGAFRIELQIITNDPLHPSRTVKVVGIKE